MSIAGNIGTPPPETRQLEDTLVANAAIVAPASPPVGSPMVPLLHTPPKTSDEIRQEFQDLADLGGQLPEGPLRDAHGKVMDTIKPLYERAALNAELREDLEAKGQEVAAELFNKVRTETINLVNALKEEAAHGANGFVQWIKDRVDNLSSLSKNVHETLVEEKIPEMDGRPSTGPVDTTDVNPGISTPPLNEGKIPELDGKPIPPNNEDLTMYSTGGVPIVPSHASDYVMEISNRPALKYLLGVIEDSPEMARPVHEINFNQKTTEQINDFVTDMTRSEEDKQAFLASKGIIVPPYLGASQDALTLINQNGVPANATIGDVFKGIMVVEYATTMNSIGTEIDLSLLNLSGMYLPANASLRNANLTGADLTFAKMQDVDLEGAQIAQADFGYAQLPGADFSRALGHGADFAHANLTMASFRLAELPGARFSNANITLTNFTGANISKTDWRPLLPDDPLPVNAGSNFTGVNGGDTILRPPGTNFPY